MADDDIDVLTIPAVMPVSVPRTTPQGYPTKYLLDWETTTQRWFQTNTINLQNKITTVEAQQDGIAASVVSEQNARISADEALAEDITTISATVDDATANGEIYFAAKAAPTGSTAAYGLYLTAGSSFAGFEVIADSVLGSAIGLTADRFAFVDSGAAQQVLSYTGSAFAFEVPIIIRSGTSGARTVITESVIEVYDASNVLRVRLGLW
jgi:hypothetical protein